MKVISLWQPYATLMAIGAKTNETRSWTTTYRGDLAIQAARRWTKPQREFCRHPRVRKALEAAKIFAPELLPRGAILAVVNLYDVVPTSGSKIEVSIDHQQSFFLDEDVPETAPKLPVTLDEVCFGDYDRDRWVWRTKDLRTLATPLPCRGFQGIFNVELDLDTLEFVAGGPP